MQTSGDSRCIGVELRIEQLVQEIILGLEKLEDDHQFSSLPTHLVERMLRDALHKHMRTYGIGSLNA